MTVKELKEKLKDFDDDDIVEITDPASLGVLTKDGKWAEILEFGCI